MRTSLPVRLFAAALLAGLLAGCSPLLYALIHMRGASDSTTDLVVGTTVQGSTDDEADSITLSCGSPEGAGDESWTFVPPASGTYRAEVNGDYDCAVGIFGPDDPHHELACNDDSGANNVSRAVAAMEAGHRYFVVVDGYRGNEGSYRLTVQPDTSSAPNPNPGILPPPGGGPTLPTVVEEVAAAMQPRCQSAPLLGVGVTSGSLDPTVATARTSCGSGPGGDVLYRLVVPTTTHVTVKLEATFDGILELRSACTGAQPIACNDDTGDAVHSQVSAQLSAGTYFVVVDSYDPRSSGPFNLQVVFLQ